MKEFVFEKLGKAYLENRKDARNCLQHGYDQMAAMANHQALGIEQAVEALGFDVEEFRQYLKENRNRLQSA